MEDNNNKYRKASIFNPLRHLKYLFKKPVTKPMNRIMTQRNADYLNDNGFMTNQALLHSSPRVAPTNTRGFHTNDWEKCIGCSTCETICPTNAITMVERLDVKDEAGKHQQRPVIDYGKCCFCALCVDTCTTGSLEMSKEYLFTSSNPDDFILMPEKLWQGQVVDKGWVKDEVSDLLDLKRVEMEHYEPEKRLESFIEIVKGYSKESARAEAARCVECGVCTTSCPVQMHIPQYIKAIWEDDIEGGLRQIYETNPLPGVCGRVCTHNCETACAIAVRGEAIAIRWLKRYIIDSAPQDMYEKIILEPVSEVIDAKVAIVGSGPSGLSAAYYLKALGYTVDVYEEKDLPGGIMRYGIPSYRLPDSAIDKDINFMKKIGVNIHTKTRVGKNISLDDLENKYDAVFLGTGFFRARGLNIPGADHKDVIAAMDFLPLARDLERGKLKLKDIEVADEVLVIGGGDVAFDVARSVSRIQILKYGKANVKLSSLEDMDVLPASQDEVMEGIDEGIQFFCGQGPQEVLIKDDKVVGMRLIKCTCVFDVEGKFNPQFDPKCELNIDAKQIFLSIGQMPDYNYIPEPLKAKMQINRGKIKADQSGQVEGVPWLFVGGDVMRGPDLISGVADGHRAAQAIDDYLYSKEKQKQASLYIDELRQAVKDSTPELTHKQKARL